MVHPDDRIGDPVDHDRFHPPTSADPWWSETTWFNFVVPERRFYCAVYPWIRPNLGIFGGGVMAWDDRGRTPWDALHWDYEWHAPYPEPGDLRDITFPDGVSIRCLEPMRRWAIAYEHPDFALDVHWEAILPAHVVGADGSGTFAGHLDQQGRATGTMRIGDETVAVDAYGIRDRSWGRRVPTPGLHIGYDVGTGADVSFLAFSAPDDGGAVYGGSLAHAGVDAPLVSGTRTLEREGVWPTRLGITALDEQGRRFEATGTPEAWMSFQNLPSMTNIVCVVRWEVEVDGLRATVYGEVQDVWDADRYRRFSRGLGTDS